MTQPITDIRVSYEQAIPPGFVQVPVDLNWGTMPYVYVGMMTKIEPTAANIVYLNFHRWPDKEAPITGVNVIVGKKSRTPAGWVKDGHDLNHGVGGNFIYLIWKKGGPDTPVLDLLVQAGGKSSKENIVLGGGTYHKIPWDLNREAKGQYIFLYYLQDNPENSLQEKPPEPHDYHAMIEWVNQPSKEFEVSRAQVRHDRVLIHTQKLVVDKNRFITARTPFNEKVVRIEGSTQKDITQLSREISFEAGADLKNWGLGISTRLGYKTTEMFSHELAIEERTEREEIIILDPVDYARQLFICHVADVLSVYDIQSEDLVARVINDTNVGGTFMRDTEAGPFKPCQIPQTAA